jgi:hypothetical protein
MVICLAFPLRFGQRFFHLRRVHTGNDVSIKRSHQSNSFATEVWVNLLVLGQNLYPWNAVDKSKKKIGSDKGPSESDQSFLCLDAKLLNVPVKNDATI